MPRTKAMVVCVVALLFGFGGKLASASQLPQSSQERVAEWTIVSGKSYVDPFNDVDVDVVFQRNGQEWRVPTFWRGGSRWTVRFAPPEPGEYTYRLDSTDKSNPDLNGHAGRLTITAYKGTNALLQHGMLRVSANKRYFEHADGTPFYWLGDTWWSALSTRLSWVGFQKLTADRKEKGFTVVQIVAGMVPFEERAPSDPGYCNEGGCVWEPEFKRINPRYFDYADRRMQHLVNSGLVPAIVGAWQIVGGSHEELAGMGIEKLKKHWRYIIARYGALPVIWIAGGSVFDPPEDVARKYNQTVGEPDRLDLKRLGGWTNVTRYIRDVDPMHHPVTVHEHAFAAELPLQDESLTDFQLFQPSHAGWASIEVEIAQLNTHYARTAVTKPLVVGEIGYERLGGMHLEDFQRVGFWLAMLNGAAGFSYGADGVWESYTSDKPFHRLKWSLLTWEEGMSLPGSYQIGLGAKLLEQYRWWRFEPHPEWVTPHGTTLLEPRGGVNRFHVDIASEWPEAFGNVAHVESEWKKKNGDFHLPYAAGIPGEVRFIYMPYFGLYPHDPPTILGIERNVRYHAYYWEPSSGIKIDLGAVQQRSRGGLIFTDAFETSTSSNWADYATKSLRKGGRLSATGQTVAVVRGVTEENLVAGVSIHADSNAGLLLRFHDPGSYLAAVYSAKDKRIYLVDEVKGVKGNLLGSTPVTDASGVMRLTAEVQGHWAIVSLTDATHHYTSEIVHISDATAGGAGLMHVDDGVAQAFGEFELRRSVAPDTDEHLEKRLYNARGAYHGSLTGGSVPYMVGFGMSSWDDFGKEKITLLDAYRPERLPFGGDWVLVLENRK